MSFFGEIGRLIGRQPKGEHQPRGVVVVEGTVVDQNSDELRRVRKPSEIINGRRVGVYDIYRLRSNLAQPGEAGQPSLWTGGETGRLLDESVKQRQQSGV